MISIRFKFNATICSIAFLFGLVANVNPCHGQTEFVDVFDGNAEAWTVLNDFSTGTFSVIDGSYVAAGGVDNVGGESALSIVTGLVFDDVSVQSTATLLGRASFGFAARLGGDRFSTGYFAVISSNGGASITRLDGPNTGFVDVARGTVEGFTANDELNLRFDAVGNDFNFWAWPMGGEMPITPTLTGTDSTYAQGVVGLAFLEFGSEQNATGAFRDFRAVAIPEPASTTLLMCGLLVSLAARSRTRHSQV